MSYYTRFVGSHMAAICGLICKNHNRLRVSGFYEKGVLFLGNTVTVVIILYLYLYIYIYFFLLEGTNWMS